MRLIYEVTNFVYLDDFYIVTSQHARQWFQNTEINNGLHLVGLATRDQVCHCPCGLLLGVELAMGKDIDDFAHQIHFKDSVNLIHCAGGNVRQRPCGFLISF